MRCDECIYFQPDKPRDVDNGNSSIFKQNDTGEGQCRRRAPLKRGWPVVRVDDWCGEHEAEYGVYAIDFNGNEV